MLEQPRACSGRHAARADVVLDRDRDAKQGRVGWRVAVEFRGAGQRAVAIDEEEGVERRVGALSTH